MKITSNQPQSRRVDIEASLPRTDRGIMDATATAEWQGPVTCVNLKPGRQPGRLVPVEDFEALANVGAEPSRYYAGIIRKKAAAC